jgi:hypothetical protein
MITLKDAIKEFPKNQERIIRCSIPQNFNELSYTDKVLSIG